MGMNREGAVDVLFVAMPFCDEYMPCLTLALFKSVLARAKQPMVKPFLLLTTTSAG